MRILLTALCAIALLATASVAQVTTYATVGGGSLMKSGESGQFAMYAATNTSLHSDSASGFTAFNRTGYFYSDGVDQEIQGLMSFMITQKTFNMGSLNLSAAVGGGVLYAIEEGDDLTSAAIKVELGVSFFKFIGLAFGADYVPIKGEGDETFAYVGLDLSPF